MNTYAQFLEGKAQTGGRYGCNPHSLPDWLFDFQRALVTWAVEKGRAAIMADCGLGKTPMQLVWADNVIRQTGRPVLLLAPLAVGQQTCAEAEKFGIEAERSKDGKVRHGARVVVANYERLHLFDPADFAGVVCDESSILKNFDGVRKSEVTAFMRKMPYRLLCTATAAPNDFTELGTSAEALGELGHMDMLGRFFVNDQNTVEVGHRNHGKAFNGWRFKGHAETAFWRWVCSWGRACRKPSDLGFSDDRFALPDLIERDHVVTARRPADGMMFTMPAVGFREEREERRRTVEERCEMAASLVQHTGEPAVIWCHLNPEGDLLSKLIPDAVQVSGADSDDEKEEAYEAFAAGRVRVLVIKPKIGAFGLNWQHCAHVVTFATHSYEQHYQAVRRCWRFGQTRPVTVDVISTEGESAIRENLRRKQQQADEMFAALVQHMNDSMTLARSASYPLKEEVPSWL